MLTLFFGSLIGLSLGLTGGGGSLIAIPLLVYGLGVAPHEAIGVSLATVGIAAASGAAIAWRRGLLEMRSSLLFAGGGIVGAPIGTFLGKLLGPEWLMVGFALLALVVGVLMWRRAALLVSRAQVIGETDGEGKSPICRLQEGSQILKLNSACAAVLVATGAATGLLTGLFGVGGGFVIVPALVLIIRVNIHRAVANSLLVITLLSSAGILGLLAQGWLPPPFMPMLVIGSVVGLMLGVYLGKKLPTIFLQKAFGVIVVALGLSLLILECVQ